MIRAILLCALCAFLTSCAVGPRTVEKEDLSRIRTVGVISLIGDRFYSIHVGFTVFGNRRAEYPGADWRIDDIAEDVATTTLERNGRYQVVRVNHKGVDLQKVHTGSMYNPANFDAIESQVRALVAAQPVDALIVFTKNPNADLIAQTNQNLDGVGLYSRGFGEQIRVLAPYAWYRLTVLHGSTLKPIGSRMAEMPRPKPGLMQSDASLPFKPIDVSHYKEDLSQMTDGDRRAVQQALREVLIESTQFTLDQLGFAVR